MFCHNPYAAASSFTKSDDVMGVPHNSGLSDSNGCQSRCITPTIPSPTGSRGDPSHSDGGDEDDGGMGRRSTSKYYDALSPMIACYEYGQQTRAMMSRDDATRMGLTRLFVGQVPYHLEPAHVAWMLELLSGRRVPLVEKIVRWTQSRKPCGCFHLFCERNDVDAFLQIDQTVLCEAELLWRATDAAERFVLAEHCKYLKENPDARTPLMPYQLMTVQPARSDYRPPQGRGRGAAAPH